MSWNNPDCKLYKLTTLQCESRLETFDRHFNTNKPSQAFDLQDKILLNTVSNDILNCKDRCKIKIWTRRSSMQLWFPGFYQSGLFYLEFCNWICLQNRYKAQKHCILFIRNPTPRSIFLNIIFGKNTISSTTFFLFPTFYWFSAFY